MMNVVDSPLLSDSLQSKLKETLLHGQYLAGTQYSRNTWSGFPQRCSVQDIQGTFREHFKGKDLLKSSQWKSCFCVKCDLIITTVDLLANSSNHLLMFPEHSGYI